MHVGLLVERAQAQAQAQAGHCAIRCSPPQTAERCHCHVCVCVCGVCRDKSNPVQSSPVHSVQSNPPRSSVCELLLFPPKAPPCCPPSPIKQRQHHQVSLFCPVLHPLGPSSTCSRCSSHSAPFPPSSPPPPGSGASIGSSQKPAVLPVNDDSTLRVSTLLEAQQRRSPPLLLRWIRPFEACDRGFRPFVVPFLPLPSPRPSCQLGRVRLPRASPHSSCMLHRPPQVLGLDDYCIHSIIWTVQG